MKNTPLSGVVAACAFLACLPVAAQAQTWTKIKNTPTFAPGSEWVATDGSVWVHDEGTGNGGSGFWKLTPDATGSYINGTWTQLASLPTGYTPLYYGSAILPDGRLIMNGGEYNGGGGVWTTKGAIYDPVANSWASVAPPTGWSSIGDAQSTLLNDGTYMLANCCTTQEATLNLSTMAWTATGTGKHDINDEEGWTLLPSGQVLTVDANDTADVYHTEILTAGKWTFAGDTPVELPDLGTKTNSHELGPQVLRPDGTVFAAGAIGHTAVYTVATGKWTTGPDFPKSGASFYDCADAPGVLLPDGNVLVAASPGVFNSPTQFYEFNGSTLTQVAATPNAPSEPSFVVRLLILPNGQVMQTDGSNDVEFYTPAGKPFKGIAPKLHKVPGKMTHGMTYTITGLHLNGMSQAVAYGDDYQAATNYPIVRITNTASKTVTYAKTSGFSSMAVANPAVVSASVAIPAGIPTGASTLEVVANGIASKAVAVTIN